MLPVSANTSFGIVALAWSINGDTPPPRRVAVACTKCTSGSGAREKLSSREVECLRWAAAGKSSDEIAIILGISAYTVSSYFKSATRKLDAVNRMQAIARAMRMKLI